MGNRASRLLKGVEVGGGKDDSLETSIALASAEVKASKNEHAVLQARVRDLEDQYAKSQQEHQERCDKLQSDLKARDGELQEQRQTAQAALQDKQQTEEMVGRLQEQVKALEAHRDALVQDSVLERSQAQTMALNSQEKMQDMLIELAEMHEEIRKLAASNRELVKQVTSLSSRELDQFKADAASELEAARATANAEIVAIKASAKKDIETARSIVSQYEQNITNLSQELEFTKAVLAKSQANTKPETPFKKTAPAMDSKRNYWEPYRFSAGKDLRIDMGEFRGEMRVDIREWYSNVRSKKGVSIPLKDARELAAVLPDVVRQAELEEMRHASSQQPVASNATRASTVYSTPSFGTYA